MPTYFIVPLISSALFLVAAAPAIMRISEASALTAVTLGALWLLLLIMTMRENSELAPLGAAALAFVLSRTLDTWLADAAGLTEPMGQVTIVLAVMCVTAAWNVTKLRRLRRQRGR